MNLVSERILFSIHKVSHIFNINIMELQPFQNFACLKKNIYQFFQNRFIFLFGEKKTLS